MSASTVLALARTLSMAELASSGELPETVKKTMELVSVSQEASRPAPEGTTPPWKRNVLRLSESSLARVGAPPLLLKGVWVTPPVGDSGLRTAVSDGDGTTTTEPDTEYSASDCE